ncbi:DegT/DnrJ/EryC1/StrS family aminotransferase [Zooshikella ganghwensis]|uniref:DegT/DnrJ/EryC1/StrS family aminotransferase n=1 Tax=Zooshikella ganghwensis TaxID=202772 RepID=A0A4P9VM65_9GAMM|nr:DegT/DnrJ/EryC1/StrS family aminotransferase [Zooshikella ganghwensis]RDH43200.1 DegT/DnrJ/EryC1/StrS family aminotransferase [Zooshikella ganghwensis]
MIKKNIAISLPCTGEDEWLAIKDPIVSGWLTQGVKVNEFENEFAKKHGVKHALATTSCTTGLHLILVAMGIGPGDEVIVPAFTWVATANVVLYCGATPVFADIDPKTNNIYPSEILKKITDQTKAVIVVHLFGLCADMRSIRKYLPSHIKIIEDAACAAGASYHGVSAGGLGDAAAFSFHPRKSITTGEGGMITTNDTYLAEKMVKLRNHGAEVSEEQRHLGPKPYLLPDFNLLGFNYRMTDLQGAIGLVQLQKLERYVKERRYWADYYSKQLKDVEWIGIPEVPDGIVHAWQAYVLYIYSEKSPLTRNEIMEVLQSKGISTRPGTHAVHMLNYYAERFGLASQDYPNAKLCNDNTMAIPLHNRMEADDYQYVIDVIKGLKYL